MDALYISGANGLLGTQILASLNRISPFDSVYALARTSFKPSFGSYLSYEDFFNNELPPGIFLHLAFARSTEFDALQGSLRLLESLAARSSQLRLNIVHISSQSVYNPHRVEPAKETDLPAPRGPYGVFKYYSESYLEEWANLTGLRSISLRLGALMGPGMEQRIMVRLLKQAINEGAIVIRSRQECFSFLHLEDAASLITGFLPLTRQAKYDRYNIGNFEKHSLRDIGEIIQRLLQEKKGEMPKLLLETSEGPQSNNTLNLDRWGQEFPIDLKWDLKNSLSADYERLF